MSTPTLPDSPTQTEQPESDHDVLVEIQTLLRAILESQNSAKEQIGATRRMQRKLAGL